MFVKDIMSKDIQTLSPEDVVSDFISMMIKSHIHEVIIMDNKKLAGVLSYKTLTKKEIQDPSKTKIRAIMDFPPATLSMNDSIETASKSIFETGARALPVVENGNVVGIISSYDIIKQAAKEPKFKSTKINEIMSAPEVLNQTDDIGKARVVMRQLNVSRLPIVDDKGEIVGIVAAFDLLKAMKPRERMGWYSMAAEMDKISRLPVTVIMNTKPPIMTDNPMLSDIAEKMFREKVSGVVIVKDSKPIGVVTLKDMIEFYVSGFEKKGVYYQIIGIEKEDDMVLETAERMIADTLKKLNTFLDLQFFFVHVKKKETGIESRSYYTIRTRLRTNKGLFISKGDGWDLRDAMRMTMDNLERLCKKDRVMIRERSKRQSKLAKGR